MISSCTNSNTEKVINCSGLCNKTVHAACLKFNNAVFSLFNSYTNFKWFCDDCQILLATFSRNSDGMFKLLLSLSEEVKTIVGISSGTSDKRTTRSAKRNLPRNLDIRSASSSTAGPAPVPSPVSPALAPSPAFQHSERTAHHHIQHQPYRSECFVGTGDIAATSIKSVPETKYIYASRFANSTTPDALKDYLCTKLGLSEVAFDCRLLVAAGKDVNSLNFISFKIGVNVDLYTKLLVPNIWPAGILVREFVHRSKNLSPAGVLLE